MSLVKRQRTENITNGSSLIPLNGNDSSILYNEAVVLEGHVGPVLGAKFSTNGKHIATGGFDKDILLWSLPTIESNFPNYGVIKGHKSAITSLRWASDDSSIITSSADATVGFWDVETGKRIRKCIGHELVVNEIDVYNDLAISASDDGYACLWDSRYKSASLEIKTDYPLLTACFANHGNTVYISGIDPTILAYDIRSSEKPLWSVETSTDSITSLSVSNDDSVLISRSIDGIIRSYSANSFVPEGISRLNPYAYDGAPSGNENYLIRTCFSKDNISFISGSEDKSITIWDYHSRKLQKKLIGHKGTVIDVDYHPTEKIVLSTSNDGTVIVREV